MSLESHGGGDVGSHPIDPAALADYWLAKLSDADGSAIEEHLLECDECGARLREVIGLAEGLRRLAGEGSLRMVVSDAFLERARAEGLRVREYAPPPGGDVQCTVTAEDDLLVARLSADLVDVTRVDLCVCDGHGAELHRLSDIPVQSATDSVIYQESIAFAKAAPTTTLVARLVAVDDTGGERQLGEYTFRHTRSLPGPGSSQPVW